MRWVLAAFLLLPLTGCAGCGPNLEEVRWTEPGLYALLDRPVSLRYGNVQWVPPQGALPFNATVEGQPVPAALQSVTWDWPAQDGTEPLGFWLGRDGVITALVPETTSNDTVLQGFLAFAANVTTATPSERVTWAEEFLRNHVLAWTGFQPGAPEGEEGTDVNEHSVKVPGPFRLEALAKESHATWTPLLGAFAEGDAGGAGYGWHFGLATWKVPLPDGDHGATLTVDPMDRVDFDAPFKEGESTASVQARARKAMVEDGLPAPTFQDYDELASIC
ncbi:MAG TPA: hypothetical protein VM327_09435 [Candidatus Thermoplasmatota archaeon]|nr:hypothetical protein [Candidatus Thermoplasmatota archaeon]